MLQYISRAKYGLPLQDSVLVTAKILWIFFLLHWTFKNKLRNCKYAEVPAASETDLLNMFLPTSPTGPLQRGHSWFQGLLGSGVFRMGGCRCGVRACRAEKQPGSLWPWRERRVLGLRLERLLLLRLAQKPECGDHRRPPVHHHRHLPGPAGGRPQLLRRGGSWHSQGGQTSAAGQELLQREVDPRLLGGHTVELPDQKEG